MGKSTDKMYMTASEWQYEFGGAKQKRIQNEFKRLPFSCCSLSFLPFEHPVCTPDGMIFDLLNIVPWLKKHGTNPITGESLEGKSLIKLHWYKNDKDEYHCPITFKIFNDHTHIVAIRTSGNVYSMDAVQELNIKTKNWKDLLTDEKFTRKDIITLQDPHNMGFRNMLDFHFVKNGIETEKKPVEKSELPNATNINAQGSTSRILKEMATMDSKSDTTSFVKKEKKAYNAAHFSNGLTAYSLTSMSFTPATKTIASTISDEEYVLNNVTEKGYIQIKTNFGEMNFELYCKEAPRACFNIIRLAKNGYYDNVAFHRSIKGFMLQGGDPTGTGSGGDSIWKKPFRDEFCPSLKHSKRGVLSMANRGKDSNTSQFFILYEPARHLDNKHTVFGQMVSGLEVLEKCEQVGTSPTDQPLTLIKIIEILVVTDPFELLLKKDDIVEEQREQKKHAVNVFNLARTETKTITIVSEYCQGDRPSRKVLEKTTCT
jgi:peptidyl-prolyl cis-trans isomerase-like 2